ncbi:MAG: 50S ribosomal protein L37ae [Candidatus Nanoarchaeia archaeon]|nr:50S ribosomal protein L37ae [Candidatus Nanoarchaeia archaeon]
MATKILKSAGRFGARYGKRLKSKLLSVETLQKKKQVCPYCMRPAAKRLAPGIWLCKKCNMKFTGNAYTVK